VQANHNETVACHPSDATNVGGRPELPELTAVDGYVEALVALNDDADSLDRIFHGLDRMRRATAQLEAHAHERLRRLRDRIVPEVERCYNAAEAVYQHRSRAA